MSTLTITSTIKSHASLPFLEIKDAVLGKRYELSLVFVGAKRATTLNRQYRDKTYTPNVLSFPLTATQGEIIICPQVAATEAAKFNLSKDGYIAYLFIHGLLHLKGLDHSDTMEKMEHRYLNKFNIS